MKINLMGSGSGGSKDSTHSNDLADITQSLQSAPASITCKGGRLKPDWALWSHTAAEETILGSRSPTIEGDTNKVSQNANMYLWPPCKRHEEVNLHSRTTMWPRVSSSPHGVLVHILIASGAACHLCLNLPSCRLLNNLKWLLKIRSE